MQIAMGVISWWRYRKEGITFLLKLEIFLRKNGKNFNSTSHLNN